MSVGKVLSKSLDLQGNRTIATIQMDNQFAPVHEDTRAILRTKTILGETYVELSPGTPRSPTIPDGGMLARGNVQPAVQLDQIFDALDPRTRAAFRQWQQELAQAVRGNGQNLNDVLGNLPTFAGDATDLLRVLDVQHTAVVNLVQNARHRVRGAQPQPVRAAQPDHLAASRRSRPPRPTTTRSSPRCTCSRPSSTRPS